MSFSLLQEVTFTVTDYSFGKLPNEIDKVINQNVKMVFSEGKVDFLGKKWEAKVVEDGDKNFLYLISDMNSRIFRITLIAKKDMKDFMDSFLSGDIRVREDGDFFLKSLLRPVHCEILRETPIQFTIEEDFLKYVPPEHQKNFVKSKTETNGSLNFSRKSVSSWSTLELCENLVVNKIIDEEDATILKNEKVDGNVFLEIDESELKEIGLTFGARKRLMGVINKI
jgi:hypothetical protein